MIMMEKLLICITLVVYVGADNTTTTSEEDEDVVRIYAPWYRKVVCSSRFEHYRDIYIEEAKCEGKPKRELILLPRVQNYELMDPRVAWSYRCRGPCAYDTGCVTTSYIRKYIPVRIYNANTNKEACARAPIDEHEECSCPEDYTRRKDDTSQPQYDYYVKRGVGKIVHETFHELP